MSKVFDSVFVNATEIVKKAYANKYAIPHININNLEWVKAVLTTAEALKSPVILGVSEGAVKYISGFKTVVKMVVGVMQDLNIKVPVALHLDHGSYEGCKKALAAGFSSVMFDGSHLEFADNLVKAKEIVDLASTYQASVEVEVGTIGGEEDGVSAAGELADLKQCQEISKLKISMLAAGIGNVHGIYPEDWKGLSFETLKAISEATKKPMVLHGGTGIPNDQILKAISLGISKINVNTELQLAFAKATRKYVEEKKDLDLHKKGFDPRKLLKPGTEAMAEVVKEKMTLFGSVNKA